MDFQLLKLRNNIFLLLKPPGLWYFATLVLADKYKLYDQRSKARSLLLPFTSLMTSDKPLGLSFLVCKLGLPLPCLPEACAGEVDKSTDGVGTGRWKRTTASPKPWGSGVWGPGDQDAEKVARLGVRQTQFQSWSPLRS